MKKIILLLAPIIVGFSLPTDVFAQVIQIITPKTAILSPLPSSLANSPTPQVSTTISISPTQSATTTPTLTITPTITPKVSSTSTPMPSRTPTPTKDIAPTPTTHFKSTPTPIPVINKLTNRTYTSVIRPPFDVVSHVFDPNYYVQNGLSAKNFSFLVLIALLCICYGLYLLRDKIKQRVFKKSKFIHI